MQKVRGKFRLLLLAGIVAAAVLPFASAEAGCPNTVGPNGTPGVTCDVNWTCVQIPPGNNVYYNLCVSTLEALIDGPYGAEIGRVDGSFNGQCYSSGVGVCYRKKGVYTGAASVTGCTGAGFHGDQLQVSVLGVGQYYDISDNRVYSGACPN